MLGNNSFSDKKNLLISDRISDAKIHRKDSYLNMTLKEGGRILLVTLSLFSRTLAEKCSDIHFKGIKSSKVREGTFPRAHISFRFIALPVWLMFGV